MLSLIPPQYRLGIAVGLFLAWSGFCWWNGHSSAMESWEAAQAKAEKVSLQATLNMERKGAVETVRYLQKVKVIHDEIEKLVPIVTPQDDSRCALPPDFAGMWNRVNRASTPAASDPHAPPDPASVAHTEASR